LISGTVQRKITQSPTSLQIIKAEFFNGSKFKPTALVDYMKGQIDVFHNGSDFFTYDEGGVWRQKHDNFIGQMMTDALGAMARRNHVQDAMKLIEWQVFKSADDLAPPKYMINCLNGMLDIEEVKLKPHCKEYFSTIQLPISFDPNADCPRFKQYLREVFEDDLLKAQTLQEFSGYCLYPKIFIAKCLFLIGGGANGKSVFINTLCKIIGNENVSCLELHQLSDKFLLGTLRDKLLNQSTEVRSKSQVADSVFKQVVAGDPIQADVKHKEPIVFRPVAKHIFSMNDIPVITDRTFAFSRRVIIVKFNKTFAGDKADKRLEDNLSNELPGILNWALVGLQRVLTKESITESEQMIEDKKEFMRAINPVSLFVDEMCRLEGSVKKVDLYNSYKEYCNESGLQHLSRIKFNRQLQTDFPLIREDRPGGSNRLFEGISLQDPY